MAARGNILTENYKTFGDYEGLGVGSIDPAERTDIDHEIARNMRAEVASGTFNVPVTLDYIKWCVDTRLRADGTREDNPSGAGATLSMIYARAMTPSGLLVLTNDVELASNIGQQLADKGIEMGVHGGDHSDCDCGACAKAKAATGLIISHSSSVRGALNDLGVAATDLQHDSIVNQTSKLHQMGFFVERRPEVIDVMKTVGAEYEHLVDNHDELLVAVNTIPGTTVSREAVYEKYGKGYGLFVLDAWALAPSAELVNLSGESQETADLTMSMAYYNMAVAAQLSGKSMPFVPVIGQ